MTADVWLPIPPDEIEGLPKGPRYHFWDGAQEYPADPADCVFYVVPYMKAADVGVRPLPLMSSVEVVQTLSAGVDHVQPGLRHLGPGVRLCNARGVHEASTAELALALVLASLRGLPDFVRAQERGEWLGGFRPALADRNVLVVGYGRDRARGHRGPARSVRTRAGGRASRAPHAPRPAIRPYLQHPAAPGAERGRYPVSRPIAGSLGALAPYLAAAVCTLGILYTVLNGRSVDRVVLLTGGTVVLALVVRQGIMLLDNITLTQELAHKENHFRSLVQGSSDVIMIAAPSGILRYVSPAAAGVYGRPAEDLVGTELAQLIHPEDLDCVVHEVRRFLAAGPAEEPTTRIECRFRFGGGGTSHASEAESGGGWLNVESTVNRHHGGLIFNSRDVTERVRLQAQLQHNAEHDPLTDLPNRALFTRRVQQALSGRRASDRGAALGARPCSSSTSTASRPSTTPSATRPATNC
ncbi:hypothetical protein SHIRM173S_02707 [Streptomyces hirsutus]